MFSEEEETERPTKKRCIKKAVVRDEDEEETTRVPLQTQTQKKQKEFKSKAMLSDTNDETS
ncbi:hypothetical protein DXG01_009892 [Tephrocybe rancida]|nr:hypothetical protein DXG01_009892 [Tephrocybe rancida]